MHLEKKIEMTFEVAFLIHKFSYKRMYFRSDKKILEHSKAVESRTIFLRKNYFLEEGI